MDVRVGINADSSTIDGNLAVLDGLLGRFRDAGFTHAEIPVHGVDCLANGRLLRERAGDVGRLLKKYPLAYTVHGPDALNLADPARKETHASTLRAAVDFASEIGAEILVYHGSFLRGEEAAADLRRKTPGAPFEPAEARRTWEKEIERLAEAAAHAAKRGVTIAAENIFRQSPDERTYRIDPRELACVVEAVDSPALGICLDFGHAFISSSEEGFSLQEALEAVKSRLVHVHIHDNFGLPPPPEKTKTIDALFLGSGDLHLPPGWGSIPYAELFPRFAAAYRGVYMLELQPRFADRYRKAADWVRGIVEDVMKK